MQCRKLFLSAQEPSVSAPSCRVGTEMGMSKAELCVYRRAQKNSLGTKLWSWLCEVLIKFDALALAFIQLLACGTCFCFVTQTRASYRHLLLRKIVLKAVLPDMCGSVWTVGSYRGVKADTTLMFSFSGAALQICFSKRVERGEPDRMLARMRTAAKGSHLGKGNKELLWP